MFANIYNRCSDYFSNIYNWTRNNLTTNPMIAGAVGGAAVAAIATTGLAGTVVAVSGAIFKTAVATSSVLFGGAIVATAAKREVTPQILRVYRAAIYTGVLGVDASNLLYKPISAYTATGAIGLRQIIQGAGLGSTGAVIGNILIRIAMNPLSLPLSLSVDYACSRLITGLGPPLSDHMYNLGGAIGSINVFNEFMEDSFQLVHRMITQSRTGQSMFETFQTQLNQQLYKEPLENTLRRWSDEFQTNFPYESNAAEWGERPIITGENFNSFYASLLSLEDPMRRNLSLFLQRIPEIRMYQENNQMKKLTILRIDRMLQMLRNIQENPEFRTAVCSILEEASITCDNRLTLAFDDIEVAWLCHRNEHKLDEQDLAQFLIGIKRWELLRAHAGDVAAKLPDPIEAILYYQTQLKDRLKLPTSTTLMARENLSLISPHMLNVAENAVLSQTRSFNQLLTILSQSKYWKAHLEKTYPEAYAELVTQSQNLLDQALKHYNREELIDENGEFRSFLEKAVAAGATDYTSFADFTSNNIYETLSRTKTTAVIQKLI